MILAICACYLLCNAPFMCLAVSGVGKELPTLRKLLENVFLGQYSANFVVYAASNKQYREAYLFFLNTVLLRRASNEGHVSSSLRQQVDRRSPRRRQSMSVAVIARA